MIGKRIILTIGGLAVLICVAGFMVGASISKSEITAAKAEGVTQQPESIDRTLPAPAPRQGSQSSQGAVGFPQSTRASSSLDEKATVSIP